MVTALESLKEALRDMVGPALRESGYKGSGRIWRSQTMVGDWVFVHVQTARFMTPAYVKCTVNLGIVPAYWIDFMVSQGYKRPTAGGYGMEMLGSRLGPSQGGQTGWWEVTDPQSALAAAADIVDQLKSSGLPALARLMDRDILLASIQKGDLGIFRTPEREVAQLAEALLMAERGPSAELDRLLRRLIDDTPPWKRDIIANAAEWIATYAAQQSFEKLRGGACSSLD